MLYTPINLPFPLSSLLYFQQEVFPELKIFPYFPSPVRVGDFTKSKYKQPFSQIITPSTIN